MNFCYAARCITTDHLGRIAYTCPLRECQSMTILLGRGIDFPIGKEETLP
jgi:hypothetical protein